MIERFQLIRNVGTFESFTAPADATCGPLTLVLGENGIGKTTVTAILRSVGSRDAAPILERARIGGAGAPHVVVAIAGAATPAIFQGGTWTGPCPTVAVYDDAFVDENVCSGLRVFPDHRHNLHGIIVGARGVALARKVEDLAGRIAIARDDLQQAAIAIPVDRRFGLAADAFAALPRRENIEEEIEAAVQRLAAAKRADEIRGASEISQVAVPAVDRAALADLLATQFPDIDARAVAAVQAHVARLGGQGEQWVAQGTAFAGGLEGLAAADCPFCAQPLRSSDLVGHYRGYFSAAYAELKSAIARAASGSERALGDDILAGSQRALADLEKLLAFWREFVPIAPSEVDAPTLLERWQRARSSVARVLAAKAAAPLESIAIDEPANRALTEYEESRAAIGRLNASLAAVNASVRAVKADAAVANVAALDAELRKLRATQARHGDPGIDAACSAYVGKATAKQALEDEKEAAWNDLDRHRNEVMPSYQAAINTHLERFGAAFRITRLGREDRGGRASSSYHIEIRGAAVPLSPPDPPNTPWFGKALSSGDRNTLALAFFFARLDLDGDLASTIVVIDDPASSLDDGRATVTAQGIRSLRGRTAQVFVLSHSRRLLGGIFHEEGGDCAVLALRSVGAESAIARLDMVRELQEEYDLQHEETRGYVAGTFADARAVARNLRSLLEGFLRKACTAHFGPGDLIGQFLDKCRRAGVAGRPILTPTQIAALDGLNEYASRFHHSSEAARVRALNEINQGELRTFATRVLQFTTPPEP